MTGRPRVLLSYWYGRSMDTAVVQAATAGWDVILDSGAFSAYTSGAQITVDEYAAWLRTWAGRATAAFSLDVIGDPVASLTNYRALVAADTGVVIVPVFHAGSSRRHLDQLLDTGCTYLAFGGLVEHYRNRQKVARWTAWYLRACNEAGARVHGLGYTAGAVRDLPFYSVDSSTWTNGARRGFVCVWSPSHRRVVQVQFRNPEYIRQYAAELRRFGVDPGRIGSPDFMRQRPEDTDWSHAVACRAFMAMDDFLRARHQVKAPATITPAEQGTKVYLACTSLSDLGYVTTAWAEHRPAAGAGRAVVGEAGPEAVMPLSRPPGGPQ